MMLVIGEFKGEHQFLSNFFLRDFEHRGQTWRTAEHAFQAAKTINLADQQAIRQSVTPGEAKRRGRTVVLRNDWEQVKNLVMYQVIRDKFTQHEDLRDALLRTYPARLVEGNRWGDLYWGVELNTGRGHNWLGRLLEDLREELSK